ncbi:hypothetical protein TrLO_g1922 [Triparma laevis f. longispina]|uniref:Uncharacterized protein n=1 Tax=Triparma laevis f. longispina TaxID=1714387 RepID=A0A9W7E9X9_9STRA|nr:hypothetical protein TrLO_g1922 [Triparma laevis f. longispina]
MFERARSSLTADVDGDYAVALTQMQEGGDGGSSEIDNLTTRLGRPQIKDVLAIDEAHILKEIDKEFPKAGQMPTAYNVIETCLSAPETGKYEGAGYKVGDWVEIQGPDTKWRLATVRRIIRQAPDEWDWKEEENIGKEPDWDFYYNCGESRMLEEDKLRAPQEGLTRIFGRRPWVWQQYALLRYENFVRFQENHQADFDEVDAQEYARGLWEEWLEDPRNHDFKVLYEEGGKIAQQELIEHIISPFIDIDDVTDEVDGEKGEWDFQDENISAFTYVAVLGSGCTVPLICFVMQMTIPLLLLFAAIGERGDNFMDSVLHCNTFPSSVYPKDESEGGSFNSLHGKIMVTLVALYYLFKVVPDTMYSFYNTAGTADTSYSKIMSMRKMVWDQGDDNVGQMIGFKADLYMNTAFECVLYSLNLFIIFNTNDILDVILNALAIEFVHQLDETFRASTWWDDDDRFIQAGTVELIIQKTLYLNMLKDYKRFAKWIGEDEGTVMAACGGKGECLYNRERALEDQENTEYMNGTEAWDWRCAEAAKKLGRRFAVEEYDKPFAYFGWENKLYEIVTGKHDTAIFNKLENYRVWSRWENVLFMATIPEKGTWQGKEADKANKEVKSTLEHPFRNHAIIAGTSPLRLFLAEVVQVVTFIYFFKCVRQCYKNKNYSAMIFRIFDGFANWFCYVYQLFFPFFIIWALFYMPSCY